VQYVPEYHTAKLFVLAHLQRPLVAAVNMTGAKEEVRKYKEGHNLYRRPVGMHDCVLWTAHHR